MNPKNKDNVENEVIMKGINEDQGYTDEQLGHIGKLCCDAAWHKYFEGNNALPILFMPDKVNKDTGILPCSITLSIVITHWVKCLVYDRDGLNDDVYGKLYENCKELGIPGYEVEYNIHTVKNLIPSYFLRTQHLIRKPDAAPTDPAQVYNVWHNYGKPTYSPGAYPIFRDFFRSIEDIKDEDVTKLSLVDK